MKKHLPRKKNYYVFNKLAHKVSKYRNKYHNRHFRLVLIKLFIWSLFRIITLPRKVKTTNSGSIGDKSSDTINIAFGMSGGMGDVIISINFLIFFTDFLKDYRVKFTLLSTHSEFLEQMLPSHILEKWVVAIKDYDGPGEFIKTEGFDLAVNMFHMLDIRHVDRDRLDSLAPKLIQYIQECERLARKYPDVFITSHNNTVPNRLQNLYATIKGLNRAQKIDIVGTLKIKEELSFESNVSKESKDEVLAKFNLEGKKFITVHRGWDKAFISATNITKVWPVEHYNDLLGLIKEKYPEYSIVQLGVSSKICQPLNAVDVNLVAKTSLDDLKVLLKYSDLHIDCEGGLVHLRQLLTDSPAVVTFGPTDPRIYAYKNNINLWADGCTTPCEWLIGHGWIMRCAKTGKDQCDRLINLSPITVMKAIDQFFATMA